MLVKELPQDMLVKIGTTYGSNFLYTGRVADMVFDNDQCLDDTWNAFAIEAKSIKSVKNKRYSKAKIKSLLKKYDMLVNWKPIPEREIVEMQESIAEKGVYRVMVEGAESGRKWLVDETDTPCNITSEHSAELLVGAIYKDLADDLIASYVKAQTTKSEEARAHVVSLERFISINPYGAFQDPEAIIAIARKIAMERIADKRGIAFARKKSWNFLTKKG